MRTLILIVWGCPEELIRSKVFSQLKKKYKEKIFLISTRFWMDDIAKHGSSRLAFFRLILVWHKRTN